ncbi:hypothetical protein JMJ35_010618 [Cladonia borealis]|uniref:AMP-dependent synthetase/ligase domain-containing protein n=1 Tax=Cladonia borealis TaxID=184061 RepID=A0AA39QSI7_9LECA|nr:hypothetical protein JMJ35_010618 [Cladonia borealis]
MATLQFTEGTDLPKSVYRRKQLLPNIIDGMAKTRPLALYAETPRSLTTYDAGYRKITYGALANAINGVAWLLKKSLGQGRAHQTLVYIGANDLGYVVMILGAVKAGYKLLLGSPRNTIADHISLFKATDCNVLLTSSAPRSPLVTSILEACSLQVFDSPSLHELLDNNYPHYPFPKTFAEARKEPLVVVHTSGTTSVPKPIIYTHDFVSSYIQWLQLEPPSGFESQVSLVQSNRLFVTLPFFHAGNLHATLFDAIANQTTIVTSPAGITPSAQVMLDGLKHTKVDSIILAAPFMEQIAKSPEMLDFIARNLETITYGGGDISETAGGTMASKSRVFTFYGSTETGYFPTIRPLGKDPAEDWKYIQMHPAAGIEFRHSVDRLFEDFIIRNTNFKDEQPVFKIFPQLMEYPTKDLWAVHPSKPNLWAYHGRADDIIVFGPGYMCNPAAMEQHVAQHAKVRAALMVSTGRSQPALLVEPVSSDALSRAEKHDFLEDLYPLVREANQGYKVGARIFKSHIIFTEPEHPMQRAGKGTVQRAHTLQYYRDTLDALYAREGDSVPGNELVLPSFESEIEKD